MSRHVPPAPPGWNKSIADLLQEAQRGERAGVGDPEIEWAREYERNQIPSGMRFPRKGDVYEVIDEVAVDYMTSWTAPYTGGGDAVLRKGDRGGHLSGAR